MNEQSNRYGRHFNEEVARIRALPPADRRAVDNRRDASTSPAQPTRRVAHDRR
jgi:hypothetical protein